MLIPVQEKKVQGPTPINVKYIEAQKAQKHGILTGSVGFDFKGVQKARKKIIKKSWKNLKFSENQNYEIESQKKIHTGRAIP